MIWTVTARQWLSALARHLQGLAHDMKVRHGASDGNATTQLLGTKADIHDSKKGWECSPMGLTGCSDILSNTSRVRWMEAMEWCVLSSGGVPAREAWCKGPRQHNRSNRWNLLSLKFYLDISSNSSRSRWGLSFWLTVTRLKAWSWRPCCSNSSNRYKARWTAGHNVFFSGVGGRTWRKPCGHSNILSSLWRAPIGR
jgi:hypothetical protein